MGDINNSSSNAHQRAIDRLCQVFTHRGRPFESMSPNRTPLQIQLIYLSRTDEYTPAEIPVEITRSSSHCTPIKASFVLMAVTTPNYWMSREKMVY